MLTENELFFEKLLCKELWASSRPYSIQKVLACFPNSVHDGTVSTVWQSR